MAKRSGKAGRAVTPLAPEVAEDADVADPGMAAKVKSEQIKQQKGKYGSKPVKPHKPPQDEETAEKEKKTSWIEIELVGEDDEPIPGAKFEITLPDGSVAKGSLDQNGFKRVEGFEKGTCKVCFPDLDKEAWEPI
ncbi:MAG: hypothetical protein JW836_17360 [Deltaproteobacteria bacterium]|nr:hypothetical protein [Deltaproteobacteria bacterium]